MVLLRVQQAEMQLAQQMVLPQALPLGPHGRSQSLQSLQSRPLPPLLVVRRPLPPGLQPVRLRPGEAQKPAARQSVAD